MRDDHEGISNPSTPPDLGTLIDRRRRTMLQSGLATALFTALPVAVQAACNAGRATRPPIGFAPIGVGSDDTMRVPALGDRGDQAKGRPGDWIGVVIRLHENCP